MEPTRILFDDDLFSEAVQAGAPSAPDIAFIFKDKGTEEGRPACCITWTSQDDQGQPVKQQNVLTARTLASVVRAMLGRYPDLME